MNLYYGKENDLAGSCVHTRSQTHVDMQMDVSKNIYTRIIKGVQYFAKRAPLNRLLMNVAIKIFNNSKVK